jgi:hypothetical protein
VKFAKLSSSSSSTSDSSSSSSSSTADRTSASKKKSALSIQHCAVAAGLPNLMLVFIEGFRTRGQVVKRCTLSSTSSGVCHREAAAVGAAAAAAATAAASHAALCSGSLKHSL